MKLTNLTGLAGLLLLLAAVAPKASALEASPVASGGKSSAEQTARRIDDRIAAIRQALYTPEQQLALQESASSEGELMAQWSDAWANFGDGNVWGAAWAEAFG